MANRKPPKEPFELPDDQCERLKRQEMMAAQMMLTCFSNLMYVREDLQDRLGQVPYGRQRMNMLIGQFRSLLTDTMGTVSDKQRHHLQGVVKDMEVRLVPKMTPITTSVVLTKDEGKELVNAAQEQCRVCSLDSEECRQCKLYRLLEAVVPLDDYSGYSCPYGTKIHEWED